MSPLLPQARIEGSFLLMRLLGLIAEVHTSELTALKPTLEGNEASGSGVMPSRFKAHLKEPTQGITTPARSSRSMRGNIIQ